jgi:hypothetical protein
VLGQVGPPGGGFVVDGNVTSREVEQQRVKANLAHLARSFAARIEHRRVGAVASVHKTRHDSRTRREHEVLVTLDG